MIAMREYARWQKRVIKELNDLQAKQQRLRCFIKSDQFDKLDMSERQRLLTQDSAMHLYAYVLTQRIDHFVLP